MSARVRWLALALLGLLIAPFALRLWLRPPAASPAAEEAAGAALSLHIITPHNQDIRRVFEAAFSDWHRERFGRPVDITFLSPGGANDIVRYLADVYGRYRDGAGELLPEPEVQTGIEIVWGGGDFTFERHFKPFLKPLQLEPALLQAAFPSLDLGGVPLLDPAAPARPKWVGVVLSSFGIIHAPELYEALELPAPETWRDLTRPELRGLLVLADPTRSGSAAFIYMMVLQRSMADAEEAWLAENPALAGVPRPQLEGRNDYQAALHRGWTEGMRTLLRIAANARYFTDSAGRPCTDVGAGEAAAAVAIDFYARVFQEEIGARRITYHAPRAATAVTPDPVGVLYGTLGAREQLARRFVEFSLSPEGQRLWNLKPGVSPYVERSLRRLPARRDVYSDRSGWADQDNPFESAAAFNVRPRWATTLSSLVSIWAAAWIDSKPTLDRAYGAVLGVQEAARRERLLFELSDLPIRRADLDASGARGGPEPRLAAARERLAWAERFRAHYERVFSRAREGS